MEPNKRQQKMLAKLEEIGELEDVIVGGDVVLRLVRRRQQGGDPAQQERTQSSALRVLVHGSIVGVLICTLGDLLLDVVVRLDGPLNFGADDLDSLGELLTKARSERGPRFRLQQPKLPPTTR